MRQLGCEGLSRWGSMMSETGLSPAPTFVDTRCGLLLPVDSPTVCPQARGQG